MRVPYTKIAFFWSMEVSSSISVICFDLCLWCPCAGDNVNHFYCFPLQTTVGHLRAAVTDKVRSCFRWIVQPPLEVMKSPGWFQYLLFQEWPWRHCQIQREPQSDLLHALPPVLPSNHLLFGLEEKKRKREKNTSVVAGDYASGWNSKVVPLLI